jgi:hypothetical protein
LYEQLKRVTDDRMILNPREGEFNFTCLEPGCRAPIDLETVRDLLGREIWGRKKREADERERQAANRICCNCNQSRQDN